MQEHVASEPWLTQRQPMSCASTADQCVMNAYLQQAVSLNRLVCSRKDNPKYRRCTYLGSRNPTCSSPSLLPQTYDSRRFQLVTLSTNRLRIMITLLVLATILGAHAVTFSSWLGEPCSGSPAIHEQTLEPFKCHSISIDNASSHASIKGWGLRNTNAKSGDFIELYLDADCQDRFSALKHSGRCFTARHRSLKYSPPGQFPDEVCYLSFFFRGK
jgi:hypothetical protein